MSDTTPSSLPEKLQPAIEELPGELEQLARHIEDIAPGKGLDIVLHLEQKYGSTYFYFPTLNKHREKIRNKWIVERYSNGERVVDIARDPRISLSDRQVWKILGREPLEEKQMKLF